MKLEELALASLARETASKLDGILPINHNFSITVVESDGTCEVEDLKFTLENECLVLIGYCSICKVVVNSNPLHSLADLGEMVRSFQPWTHQCISE